MMKEKESNDQKEGSTTNRLYGNIYTFFLSNSGNFDSLSFTENMKVCFYMEGAYILLFGSSCILFANILFSI